MRNTCATTFGRLARSLLPFFAILTTPACAQERDWTETTTIDVAAAHRLLAENHPGAVPQLGDQAFVDALERAYDTALADAPAVSNEAQYRKVMANFARTFGDEHIAFFPLSGPASAQSAGQAGPTLRSAEPEIRMDTASASLLIKLPALDERARQAVERLRANLPRGPRPRTTVIDLRGNRGGDSAIGDAVIAEVYGESALRAVRTSGTDCPVLWRASPDNAQWLDKVAQSLRTEQPNRALAMEALAEEIRGAVAKGNPFSGGLPARCAQGTAAPAAARSPAAAPPAADVTVVTDGACFSSCLIFVERLLKLGARQQGEMTSQGNWYMEVRSVTLPSGLGQFSTPQKVDLRRPKALGPFIPTN